MERCPFPIGKAGSTRLELPLREFRKRCDAKSLRPRGCGRQKKLGWLMGLEPTTTGITIRDSTN
jgi:hypothetical protein